MRAIQKYTPLPLGGSTASSSEEGKPRGLAIEWLGGWLETVEIHTSTADLERRGN